MSELLFIDSFDHYSVSQGTRKWTTFSSLATLVTGRTGNAVNTGSHLQPLIKTFNAEYNTLTMGLAYKVGSFSGEIVVFRNVLNNVNFNLQHVGDGRLRFNLTYSGGGGGGSGSPSAFVMSLNQWYYFEVQATLTGGPPAHIVASARVNGAEFLTWDFTDDGGVAGLKFAGVLPGTGGTNLAIVDDLYVTDDEFLGDVKIGVLYPNAAGDSSAWTPNAGTNWSQVEEHPADDDTSYVSAAAVALKDLYNLDDIDPAFTGTIKGVQALWAVKKSDEGDGAVKGLWKSGATELTQADGHNYIAPDGFYPSATEYLYDIQTERVSLFTAVDWTVSEINALQLGITRTV